MNKINRRFFIKSSISQVSAFAALNQLNKFNKFKLFLNPFESQLNYMDASPILKIDPTQINSQEFNGDDIERTHKILWNVEGFIKSKGGLPTYSEEVDVLIVGGGMSGLLSSYFLKGKKITLLEQANNFGGNSRGEKINNIEYSIGAAYITKPKPGSITDQMLTELGLKNQFRTENGEEAQIFYKSQFSKDFWSGNTDIELKQQFELVHKTLKKINDEKFPEIPFQENSQLTLSELHALDQISFQDWLNQNFSQLHPQILEYFQLYAWSSFGGSIDELSAAQMLNFIAAETEEIWALPGGNAKICQALYNDLKVKNNVKLQSGCIVVDIRYEHEFVDVSYVNPEDKLITIRTKKCIVASPKFIAKKIISQMSQEQIHACEQIEYRAYIVANIFVEPPFTPPCFDLYCLEGQMPPSPYALKPPKIPFTDICFGTWATKINSNMGVLTVYKALPYQGVRQFLFADYSHNKNRDQIDNGIQDLIHSLGLQKNQIKGFRMTRWGHSMPLAAKGLLASGFLEKASQTIDSKIFFVNQDNCVNPSFETTISLASQICQKINSF